jgi:hypothetical protein
MTPRGSPSYEGEITSLLPIRQKAEKGWQEKGEKKCPKFTIIQK